MNKGAVEFLSHSVEETIGLGRRLGQSLTGPAIIALIGQLGTGKTHLLKGLAEGLEVPDAEEVASPTFVLMTEYQGRVPFYHLDAYRLSEPGQLAALGFDELCAGGGVLAVEWADRVWPVIAEYHPIRIELFHRGANDRLIRLEQLPADLAQDFASFLGQR